MAASDFVRAEYLGGDVRQFPGGQTFGPGDVVVLKRGEADQSDLFEIVGPADADAYSEATGVSPAAQAAAAAAPEPEAVAEQTATEIIDSLTPDNAGDILEAEHAGKGRKTVIEAAEAVIAEATDAGGGD